MRRSRWKARQQTTSGRWPRATWTLCSRPYEPNATTREPSGGPYSYTGADNIRKIYTMMFSNGGGIPLEFCTATDDGTACAIEYNAVRWGKTELPPQAGVAVYVRGKSGRLAAARIYDDVEPPAGANSSAET